MGTRKNLLGEAVLTSTYNLCFEQKYKKISDFLSENFQLFFVVKFSIYLNWRVFVMICDVCDLLICFLSLIPLVPWNGCTS